MGQLKASGAYGDGTVFEITPGSALITLHSFSTTDGHSPYAGLVQGTEGYFYGDNSRWRRHGRRNCVPSDFWRRVQDTEYLRLQRRLGPLRGARTRNRR